MSIKEVRSRASFSSKAKKVHFWYNEFVFIVNSSCKKLTNKQLVKALKRSKVGNQTSETEILRAILEIKRRIKVIPEYFIKNFKTFSKEEQCLLIVTSILKLDDFFRHFMEEVVHKTILYKQSFFTKRIVFNYFEKVEKERYKIDSLSDTTKQELRKAFIRYLKSSNIITIKRYDTYVFTNYEFNSNFIKLLKEQNFNDVLEVLYGVD